MTVLLKLLLLLFQMGIHLPEFFALLLELLLLLFQLGIGLLHFISFSLGVFFCELGFLSGSLRRLSGLLRYLKKFFDSIKLCC